MADNELDVRYLRKPDKHPTIFATYADLPVGGSFVLVNNHDPKHLYEEFEADHAGSYGWEYLEKGPTVWRIRISKLTTTPLPRVLTNTADAAGANVEPDVAGVAWKLDVRERDLDSNVITLAPNGGIDTHTGADVDVLIHVLSGSGQLTTEDGTIELAPGALLWLPRRSRRQFTAGPDGLRYLTVHQKREILPLTPHRGSSLMSSVIQNNQDKLPWPGRDDDAVQGHWLLARLGKKVLRPGGIRLTRTLLSDAGVTGADVLELAPGLGRTATEILARRPRSYVGAEQDPDAARSVRNVINGRGEVRVADAARTGLPDASRDVIIGEAMLTMQGDPAKHAIVAEASRVLRRGGCYAIHELALTPDTISDAVKTDVRQSLSRAIKVNARPLTVAEWTRLLADHGLVLDHVVTAPMALLQPRRLVSDEGPLGALRFAKNLLIHHDARRRVAQMRRTFRRHRERLIAVAIVAYKPTGDAG